MSPINNRVGKLGIYLGKNQEVFNREKLGKRSSFFWVNTGKNLWIDRIVINDLLLIDN